MARTSDYLFAEHRQQIQGLMHYEITASLPILLSRAVGAVLLGRDSEPKMFTELLAPPMPSDRITAMDSIQS